MSSQASKAMFVSGTDMAFFHPALAGDESQDRRPLNGVMRPHPPRRDGGNCMGDSVAISKMHRA
jgi:hypothetical protein